MEPLETMQETQTIIYMEKLRHLEGSSQRNNLRIEGAKVEEADSEI